MFCYFYERGINLNKSKGILSFITSNSFLRADYGKPLRNFFIQNTSILELINIEDAQIFSDATVNSVIVVLSKTKQANEKAKIVNSTFKIQTDFWTFIDSNKFTYNQSDFDSLSWNLIKPEILKLRNKIKAKNPTLEDLGTKIRLGLATGSNEAFIISEEKMNQLIIEDPKSSEIIKPMLRGRDIQRYYYNLPNLYLLITKNGVDIPSNYPAIFNHLNSFGEHFKVRGARGKHWTNLRACSFFEDFKKNKIVWIELTDSGRFSECLDEIYLLNSAYFLLPPKELKVKYLLSILNSKTIKFYLKQIANTSGVGTTRWINIYVKDFPIVLADKNTQNFLCDLSSKITSALVESQKTTKAFINYLLSKYQLEKLSKKLQNWHKLDFSDFINELNKAIKKVGGEKLSKMHEMEWMEVFEAK